jgi:hypothetical protein
LVGRIADDVSKDRDAHIHGAIPAGLFRIPLPDGWRGARHVSTYVTSLVEQGFVIGGLAEPAPDARVIAEQPLRAGLPPCLLISGLRSWRTANDPLSSQGTSPRCTNACTPFRQHYYRRASPSQTRAPAATLN